jgi:uncharacterized protein (DUF2147 family)
MLLLSATAAILALAAGGASASADPGLGTWINPKGTVVVRTARCGDAICGKVIKASREAQDKARAAGTARLVGTQILTGFRPAGAGRWQGEAFVPDMGVTVTATMVQLGRDTLEIEGCGMGGYLCRKQVWRRAPAAKGRRGR